MKSHRIIFVFILALVFSKSGNAVILQLDTADSIKYNDWNTGKDTVIHGYTAVIEVKGKKFELGCFQLGLMNNYSYNDTVTNNASIYVYKQTENKTKNTFFLQQNRENRITVLALKYIYLEGTAYKARYINNRQLELMPVDAISLGVREESDAVLSCIYDINYFNMKFQDLQGQKIPVDKLFEKGKLNIIYFTADYCPPCREQKDSMVSLSVNSKNINVVFVTGAEEDPKRFEKSYAAAVKRYYSYFRKGYPVRIYFDEDGNYVPPRLQDEVLKKYTSSVHPN